MQQKARKSYYQQSWKKTRWLHTHGSHTVTPNVVYVTISGILAVDNSQQSPRGGRKKKV